MNALHILIPKFFTSIFNIILTYKCRDHPNWSLPFRVSNYNFICISDFPMSDTQPAHFFLMC